MNKSCFLTSVGIVNVNPNQTIEMIYLGQFGHKYHFVIKIQNDQNKSDQNSSVQNAYDQNPKPGKIQPATLFSSNLI